MQIDATAGTVRLSVRELAAFRNVPAPERGRREAWRAEVGQQWHKASEVEVRESTPDARFELPLKVRWPHRGWTFHLQGRIDQLLPSSGGAFLIREIKTVRTALPLPREELIARHPDHFAQAAAYLALARVLPEFAGATLGAELLFIDIDSGIRQAERITAAEEAFFPGQLDNLLPFLEDRRKRRLALRELDLRPPFETLREGQAELIRTLDEAALAARTVLLEAPTGFGKTGIVLEHALRRMQDGLYERILYLTSKSTGQLETLRQLRAMIGGNVRYIQMRNRREHAIDSPTHRCTADERCDDGLATRWVESGIHPPELFEDGTLGLDRARRIGAATGVCPYALSRACLPFADIWIGDSNYVFSPSASGVFLNAFGFDPASTLLVVDEAHNLPARTADSLGVELNEAELRFALEELRAAGAGRKLTGTGEALADHLAELRPAGRLPLDSRYLLLDLAEDFAGQLQSARFDYETVPAHALEAVWKVPVLAQRLAEDEADWLLWSAEAGGVQATCLDAGGWIRDCLASFGGAILMSATLTPVDDYRVACGLDADETITATGIAPWREQAYDVALDLRADTRFRSRKGSYETTARTVAALAGKSPGTPVAVFFSAYQYAGNVAAYLEAMEPGLRVLIQPRGVDLAEQESFIGEALLLADVLFLILGSSYSEGVDQLGGRVDYAMVVGPALPEVNPVQKAKMERHPDGEREAAFREVYIVPGMRKIQQALGRLVRGPGQSARVVLHGRRFADPAYRQLLAPEYAGGREIRNDGEFLDWLER